MFEIDKSRFKGSNKIGILFTLFGLLLIIVMIIILININNKKSGMDKKTTAIGYDENYYTDNDGNIMYKPTFYFEVRGNTYSCTSSVSSSNSPSKDTTIYYNSNNPESCITDYELSTSIYLYLGLIISGIVLVVGIILIVKNLKVKQKIKLLSTNGKLIKVLPYSLIGTNTSLNGHQGQKIVVNYDTPNGLTKEYISETRYDLDGKDGSDLADLLIDPNNPDSYYIDFDIKYSGNVQVEVKQTQVPIQNSINQQESSNNSIGI